MPLGGDPRCPHCGKSVASIFDVPFFINLPDWTQDQINQYALELAEKIREGSTVVIPLELDDDEPES